MTGPGGKLFIGQIVLAQEEGLIGECLFSCTSAFLQYRWAGMLAMAQPQSLLVFRLNRLCFRDRGEHTQMVSSCVAILLTNNNFMCVYMCMSMSVCVHLCVGALTHSEG